VKISNLHGADWDRGEERELAEGDIACFPRGTDGGPSVGYWDGED